MALDLWRVWGTIPSVYVPVAQLDRVLASGAKGFGFKSQRA